MQLSLDLSRLPEPEEPRVWSVSELTQAVREQIETAFPFLLLVRGEISQFRRYASGHAYFTLKDEGAVLRCVLFRSRAQGLLFEPEQGQQVIAEGRIGVYERDGQYQLYVDRLLPAEGVGSLHAAFEALKAKLQAEGLFERRRPLPSLPRAIGIVTSPDTAALRDILKVARRRFPDRRYVVIPARVQGEEAPAEIARAIERANRWGELDLLIVARGGGSLEELWAFNTERVARAIAASELPVITGVGHETDFTIADFVADHRAPTPSAAAELAVPERAQLERRLADLRSRLRQAVRAGQQSRVERLRRLAERPVLARPKERLYRERQRIDELTRRLALAARQLVRERRGAWQRQAAALEALSPLAVLARGYSLALGPAGEPLRDAASAPVGARVQLLLERGRLACRVEESAAEWPEELTVAAAAAIEAERGAS